MGAALAGKGDYSIIRNDQLNTLSAEVIKQLRKAAEPAFIDCSFSFLNKERDAEDLFYRPQLRYEMG